MRARQFLAAIGLAFVLPSVTGCISGDLADGTGGSGGSASGETSSSGATGGSGSQSTSTGAGGAGPVAPCAVDGDCPSGEHCNLSATPEPACEPIMVSNGCPVLTFPSGIQIQTVPKASMTASYQNHLLSGQKAPKCFIDVGHLYDPSTQTTYDLNVKVAAHFQLSELVGTEVNQGYGNFVLLNPDAVTALEKFRGAVGVAVSVNSGFRSPKHQEDVCNGLCGHPLGCPGTCANASRHMWGDAFDLPLQFYTQHDTDLACTAGFKFTYLESGTHLHIDQNPAYAQCVQQ